MNRVFDVAGAINDRIRRYVASASTAPATIALSPASYRRLLECAATHPELGNLVIASLPILSLTTAWGRVRVLIDELLGDTEIDVC